jgi:hypothetical protein
MQSASSGASSYVKENIVIVSRSHPVVFLSHDLETGGVVVLILEDALGVLNGPVPVRISILVVAAKVNLVAIFVRNSVKLDLGDVARVEVV